MPDTVYVTSNAEFLVDPRVYTPGTGFRSLDGDINDQITARGRLKYARPVLEPLTFLAVSPLHPIPIMCQPASWSNYLWYVARYKSLRESFDTRKNVLSAYRQGTKDYAEVVSRLGLATRAEIQRVKDATKRRRVSELSDPINISPFSVSSGSEGTTRTMVPIIPALLTGR